MTCIVMCIAVRLAFVIFLCYLYEMKTTKAARITMINIYKHTLYQKRVQEQNRIFIHSDMTIIFDIIRKTASKFPPD